MRHDRRGSWYLLTGAVLGIAVGLLYAWVVSPVKYIDAPPYALRAVYKDEYRLLVASAYLYNGDLVRARDRLAQLKDEDPVQAVIKQAQQAQVEGRPEAEVQVLVQLAEALTDEITPTAPGDGLTPAPALSVPSSSSDTPSPGITPSIDPRPAQRVAGVGPEGSQAVLTPDPSAPYALQNSQLVCSQEQDDPLIQVEVNDAAGQPVPGVELIVIWEGGEDHFSTGLQPELGQGYGDFLMTPGVIYTLQVNDGGQPVNDLTAAECVAQDGTRYWGSWLLTFVEP